MTTDTYGAEAWRQIKQMVADDADLRRYLQLSFEPFHATGDWPDVERLQRRLLRNDEHLDLYAIGDRLPSELGTNPVRVENRCQLSVAGVALSPGSEEEIRDFLAVIKIAADKYLAEEDQQAAPASISSDELRDSLHLSDVAIRRLFRLIEWEPFIAGGDGSVDSSWRRNVGRFMRRFMRVASFDGYMETKLSLMAKPPTPAVPSLAFPRVPFPYRDEPSVVSPPVQEVASSDSQESLEPDRHKVFVVHGRNAAARDAMFTFLRALGLHPIEWSQAIAMTGEGSPYVGKVLDTAFAAAQAIVVLFTPDEVAYLRPEYADRSDDPDARPLTQARPNVLFEAGMAMGRDPKRTILVELGAVRPFSDVAGRHAVRLDGSAKTRADLASRLETAGCAVDRSGTDWLTAGDLVPPRSSTQAVTELVPEIRPQMPSAPIAIQPVEDLPPLNPRLKGVVRPTFDEGYLTGVVLEALDENGTPVKAIYGYKLTMNGVSGTRQESCCTPLSIGMGGVAHGTTWSISGWVRHKDEIAPLTGNGAAP